MEARRQYLKVRQEIVNAEEAEGNRCRFQGVVVDGEVGGSSWGGSRRY